MNEKILTYEEAERKISSARGAKVVVRLECGVADIYDIFKDKYIGTVGAGWAEYIDIFGKFMRLDSLLAIRRIKSNDILIIFEMEVI